MDISKRKWLLCLSVCLMISSVVYGIKPPCYEFNKKGGLSYLYFPDSGCDTIAFWQKEFEGPLLKLNGQELPVALVKEGEYAGEADGVAYNLNYAGQDGKLLLTVTCQNRTGKEMKDVQLSLHSGVYTNMTHYPQWRPVYFPTLLRCEKTHFWGYLMNPNGSILTIASPDPVASYHLFYNNGGDFGHGHLIRSFSIDLLQSGRLPQRHPQNADGLRKGEKRTWRFTFAVTRQLDQVVSLVAEATAAPHIISDFYTLSKGEETNVRIVAASAPRLSVVTPQGKTVSLRLKSARNGIYTTTFQPLAGEGVYTLLAKDGKGKTGEAKISVRYPWSDYMKSARRAALKYPQKGGSHTESWYGMFSAYLASEYFPETGEDRQVDDKFREIYAVMYDTVTNLPTSTHNRIQNHALMAALLAQRYKAHHELKDLQAAVNLVDFLLTKQTPDGAYRSGKTHYTSVIYVAKAIMEVMEQEKILAAKSEEWKTIYDRHFYSVKKAIDELTKNLDNIETEGEMTYEDGMISCSYSQIALFALLMPEGSPERQKYMEAAEFLANGHRCLSQILVPDSRMNGGSLRYWEAQYDILTFPNMMNSPHGWSAWRIYGLKYLYELTGKDQYLTGMINALGSCVQLLNPSTDELNWAFVCDPRLEVRRFVKDAEKPGKGKHIPEVIGEQYMPMISDWYKAPHGKWVTGYWGYDGGCCDNDVHEIFKCMGEIALTSAYVHEKANGEWITWNCRIEPSASGLVVIPAEECVEKVHFVLNTPKAVQLGKGEKKVMQRGWLACEK